MPTRPTVEPDGMYVTAATENSHARANKGTGSSKFMPKPSYSDMHDTDINKMVEYTHHEVLPDNSAMARARTGASDAHNLRPAARNIPVNHTLRTVKNCHRGTNDNFSSEAAGKTKIVPHTCTNSANVNKAP